MKSPLHSYFDDPLPTNPHRGYERLAIESALNDERLQRRGRVRHAVARHLPHLRH